jgi:signal transduction histidine kinase
MSSYATNQALAEIPEENSSGDTATVFARTYNPQKVEAHRAAKEAFVLPSPLPKDVNLKLINTQVRNCLRDFCQGNALALARYSRFDVRPYRILVVLVLISLNLVGGPGRGAQTPAKKSILILNEVGPSHALTKLMDHELLTGVRDTPDRHVEFYSENFDMLSYRNSLSPSDLRESLVKQYGNQKFDVVVAVGPDTIEFLRDYGQSVFLDVPIVICGSSADQADNPRLDSRFTGTWQQREPRKTLEVALRLFPDTRHVFVVGGTSAYDRTVMSLTKDALSSFAAKVEITYLTDMSMGGLRDKLQKLPERSVVLYVSFFQDADGFRFVNATKALPMIAAAANAPTFGMSDTYLGNGIVGGALMSFQEQGKVTARIVSELLDGKKVEEIPIRTLPSLYMFDWNELQTWHIPESQLPAGSVIMFREPSLWERTKWIWATVLAIILGLSALTAYLQYSRKQLKFAKDRQMQLSGMLINAGEQERSRVASELHDDFSQRVAILALGLENAQEATPASLPDLHKQLRELTNSTSELGDDLHTLSHRLHSSTIESLGLVPAVATLCKEFTTQQNLQVEFTSKEIPRTVPPDAALCIFRIVQECLRNLKKHSGAQQAQVSLRVNAGKLNVSVLDKGCGFDTKELSHKEGLGVRSMEERVRLLGGEFVIQSAQGKGTTVNAWVPLAANGLEAQSSNPNWVRSD